MRGDMAAILKVSAFEPQRLLLEETLFHCANGYVGVRGNFEEGRAAGSRTVRGTYINAFYDTHPIHHPERLFAFPEVGEKIVNVTDTQTIELFVDGEPLALTPKSVSGYTRVLDGGSGVCSRSFVWTTRKAKRVKVDIRRVASLAVRELFAVEYCVSAIDEAFDAVVVAGIDGDVQNYYDVSDPRVSGSAFKPLVVVAVEADAGGGRGRLYVESRTRETAFSLGVLSLTEGSLSRIGLAGPPQAVAATAEPPAPGAGRAAISYSFRCEPGTAFVMVRKNIFADSARHGDVRKSVAAIGEAVYGLGFGDIADGQAERLSEFWDRADVAIEGDAQVEEGLRFNLFQLLQSAPDDGRSGIPAKGLSGEGYEGHYFWDTEIYMAPFFIYTNPAIARNLLAFRHSILDGARAHARDMGHRRGAAFPWRTIAGRECSAYYPSGSAQYHINADIAYACWKYFEATDDLPYLRDHGAEVLFETARIWMELGHFARGQFRIDAVTGPDEYTCLVDNNFYTNAMARYNLENALKARKILLDREPAALEELERRIGLGKGEPALWRKAAEAMYLPYDAALDLSPQDDTFLDKGPWDFEGTARENYPLLLHYHHLTLCRYQVCKQADAVLAHFLLPGTAAESTVRHSYDYYERITTHDSSLSYAVFAAMAARLGDAEKAYRYFTETVRLDIDDRHGNTRDGIHAANMGGTWLALVFGFGGFLPREGLAAFRPILPRQWRSLSFRVTYRGSTIRVIASRAGAERTAVRLKLMSGGPIEVELYGVRRLLTDELRGDSPAPSPA